MIRDMERLAAERGLVFHSPVPFPQNSLLAARVALVASEDGWLPAFTREVYHLQFADHRDISSVETLRSAVDSASGKKRIEP